MKVMSFNCRGLAGPKKKSALMRVLTLEHPDVILLQETLGESSVIKERLESWLPGWSFVTLDVRGRSGGMAVGWKTCVMKVQSAWGMESVLGVELRPVDLGSCLKVINVYGPYQNRAPFWDSFFQNPFLEEDMVVIGGDLNFSLGLSEVWGPHAHSDVMASFLTRKLIEKKLIDVEPIKLKPTWRNNRGGEARVAKRIDRFLVSENLVDSFFQIRQWVGSGGASDHFPIFLEIRKGPNNPPSPLKFNKLWLQEESFKNLFITNWRGYNENSMRTAAFQFAENINRLKGAIKEWAVEKRRRDDSELKQVEADLISIYEGEGGGFISQESKEVLVQMEERRNQLLLAKEETWRLKSRAIWLASGDENTKFFHAYAKGRKAVNTIWSLRDEEGVTHHTFEDKARCGVNHFQNLFKAPAQASIAEVIRVAQLFPRFVEEDGNQALMKEVDEEEIKAALSSFQKDKSPGPDGWTIEFFLDLYEILGNDLRLVVEDSRISGRIPASFNSTFIALIPKSDNASSLNEFRPISLCNCIYKIIAKIIARRLKSILSGNISDEQFGFLEGRQIHEAIGVAQEGLHSLKTKNLRGAVMKIDLAKAYDKVSWLYLRLLLTHIGFGNDFIRWIMSCITTVSFSVLINGAASPFFHAERGLRQGCPLSPLLFLLVAEGLSRAILEAKAQGHFKGIQVAPDLYITHLLFVDDILIFCSGIRGESRILRDILDLFSKATGMDINVGKSSLMTHKLSQREVADIIGLFPFTISGMDEGIKYLGFYLKANKYQSRDWSWLIGKVEKRLKGWSHKWLSRAGRLVLVKSVLEAIPVYWMLLSWIPRGTLEKIRRLCFRYLWSGKNENQITPWVGWKKIAIPKGLGGWGLKNIFLFAQALAAKGGWRMLKTDSLWTRVIKRKYLALGSILDWVRNPRKSHRGGSVIWKGLVMAFPLIETNLAWAVGNGENLQVGKDPWMASGLHHILPNNVIQALRQRGIIYLSQLSMPRRDDPWTQHWRRARDIGLDPPEAAVFDIYINNLIQAHIQLNDREDELIWDQDPNGGYTPKAGYIKLSADEEQREVEWWWKPLWKLNCPAKVKLFMWCVIRGKVPTWEVLQKRNINGPGWCTLCKREQESITHLFITCSFAKEVWNHCSMLVGRHLSWDGDTVERAWDRWWRRTPANKLRTLPLLVTWGIWLARNKVIFNDKPSLPEITSAMAVGLYNAFPEHIRAAKQKRDLEVNIDRTVPWGFFDGAAQNNSCGGGGILYLSDSHYFIMTAGLGEGSNNFAEIMSLKLLLIFAIEKGCRKLNVYGDSMNVINWISLTQDCRNRSLDSVLYSIRAVLQNFETFSCRHVFRENNRIADLASKEGLSMVLGQWKIAETRDGTTQEYYHRPFIDLA